MVSWGWIPICLILGGVIGVFCMAMVEVAREDKQNLPKKWWDDDE